MKIAVSIKSLLFLSLFSMAGAHAGPASDPSGDAQQQARLLLGGRNFSASGVMSRTAAGTVAAAASSPVDAQELTTNRPRPQATFGAGVPR